jgi:serine/threonine protein kinase
MAPEVGLGQAYNEKSDVYSFTMILWYMMALEPPMGMFTPNMFIQRVFQGQKIRPVVFENQWSPAICNLLRKGWSQSIAVRPSFRSITKRLRSEIIRVDPSIGQMLGLDRNEQIESTTQTTSASTQAEL